MTLLIAIFSRSQNDFLLSIL